MDYIGGLEVGLVCPDCQSAEEHLGAEANAVTEDYSGWRVSGDDP